MTGERLAVVLFNLGGPDSQEAVRPFLFNLFNDRAIIDLPNPFRFLLAKAISRRRAPVAREIYDRIGGASPLLPITREQADALTASLGNDGGEVRVFVAMRYWHPFSDETAAEVTAFGPDRIVLLPLYPQFSGTTSGSSFADWDRSVARMGLEGIPSSRICCYPAMEGLIRGHAALIERCMVEAGGHGRPRVLFSAHGLPRKVIAAGDPYQWQVELCVDAIVATLGESIVDWAVCYQSRVGPLEWIGPSTDEEIRRAGRDAVPVVVAPVAFVSEHSETLVEIEIEYRELARSAGVPAFHRVPALGVDEGFIGGLADLVRVARGRVGLCSGAGERICPQHLRRCPMPRMGKTE